MNSYYYEFFFSFSKCSFVTSYQKGERTGSWGTITCSRKLEVMDGYTSNDDWWQAMMVLCTGTGTGIGYGNFKKSRYWCVYKNKIFLIKCISGGSIVNS